MKKVFLLLTTVGLLSLLSFSIADTLKIGDTMPKADASITDSNGNETNLNNAKKTNGLLVMFSCNTCPYVIKNQERTKDIADYALKNNIGVIILNSNEANRSNEDSQEAMKNYAATQGYNWTYAIDKNSEIADAFGANRTPECFLFDKDLKLSYHGAIDDSPSDANAVQKKYLQEAIANMASGKEIAVKESKSVGCSIKRKKAK